MLNGSPYIAVSVVITAIASSLPIYCQAEERDDGTEILRTLPSIHGESYKCADMTRVVNSLRALGKEKAISLLKQHVERTRFDGDGRAFSVFFICRCLFVNPKGWQPPGLGIAAPVEMDSAIKRFPLFPIALSEGVPFMVIQGYRLGGRGEEPAHCIEQCEPLKLITSDLPSQGYAKAAQSLVSSDVFRELYPDIATRKRVAEMVLRQAQDKQ